MAACFSGAGGGFCSESDWKRAYDEINEFEAQQCDSGTPIIKLFVHVTQEQDKRLADRLDHPWKRWRRGRRIIATAPAAATII